MKVCPQCTSLRMRRSQARFMRENFLQNRLGYRFYRCQQCNWRGRERSEEKSLSKFYVWFNSVLFVLAVILVLLLVFNVTSVDS